MRFERVRYRSRWWVPERWERCISRHSPKLEMRGWSLFATPTSSVLARPVIHGGSQPAYGDQSEMLAENPVDAVVVATPDAYHRDPVMLALASGAHVLCEKPLAIDPRECAEMSDLASRQGKRLMVNFGNRHRNEVRLARAEIAAGHLGAIGHAYLRLNERVDKTRSLSWIGSTSPTWFLHSHLVDLVTYLLDDAVDVVYGSEYFGRVARESRQHVPDTAIYLLNMVKGTIVTLESSWALPESFPSDVDIEMTFVGEEGMLRTPLSSGVARFTGRHTSVRWDLDAVRFDGTVEGWWYTSCEYFVHCLLEGEEPHPNAVEASKVTAVLTAMQESVAIGQPVRVTYAGP